MLSLDDKYIPRTHPGLLTQGLTQSLFNLVLESKYVILFFSLQRDKLSPFKKGTRGVLVGASAIRKPGAVEKMTFQSRSPRQSQASLHYSCGKQTLQ